MGDDIVSDAIEAVEERVQKLIEKLSPRHKQYAPRLTFVGSVTIGAGFIPVIKLGAPSKGYFWYIRQIRAGGVSFPTSMTTSPGAYIFVTTQDVENIALTGQFPASGWKDIIADGTTVPLPRSKGYSNGEFRVGPQETVYVVLTGGTVGDQIMASVDVFQFPDSDENIEWII